MWNASDREGGLGGLGGSKIPEALGRFFTIFCFEKGLLNQGIKNARSDSCLEWIDQILNETNAHIQHTVRIPLTSPSTRISQVYKGLPTRDFQC